PRLCDETGNALSAMMTSKRQDHPTDFPRAAEEPVDVNGEKEQITDFQLYLLARMQLDGATLAQILKKLQISEGDKAASSEAISALGFGDSGETGDLSRLVLRPPISVEAVVNHSLPDFLYDSLCLHFKLPLSPEFDFTVNENPDGLAWEPAFKRSADQA